MLMIREFDAYRKDHGICQKQKCSKPIEKGQRVVSVKGKKWKRYHKPCHESLYIDGGST